MLLSHIGSLGPGFTFFFGPGFRSGFGFRLFFFVLEGRIDLDRRHGGLALRDCAFARALDLHLRALHIIARHDEDRNPIGGFEVEQVVALLVQHVGRHIAMAFDREVLGLAADQVLFDGAHHGECAGRDRAHDAAAFAMRAHTGRTFEQTRAQALARHFEQTEMADAPHLDAGPVVLQRFLQAALDRAVVALLLHVDEVDDHEAGEIAQAQLPGDFVGCFEIGLECRILDIVLARRLA